MLPLKPLKPLPKRQSWFKKLILLGSIVVALLIFMYAPANLYRLTCSRIEIPAKCQVTEQNRYGQITKQVIKLSDQLQVQIEYGKSGGPHGARLRIFSPTNQLYFSKNFWDTSLAYRNFKMMQKFLGDRTQVSIEISQDERSSKIGPALLILLFGWAIYSGPWQRS